MVIRLGLDLGLGVDVCCFVVVFLIDFCFVWVGMLVFVDL